MRLPSLDRLAAAALDTLRRFPVVLAAAAVATVAGLALTGDPEGDRWERLIVAATLALPLTFAVTVTVGRRGWSAGRRVALLGLAVAAVVGVYLAWPSWTTEVQPRRYLQLAVGFHLAAAFLPYLGVDEPRGFWQYNRALLLRFLVAAFYVVVLQAGLSLAIGALDQLFGVPVPDDAYLWLWIVLALLFQTWFFLAGVPNDLAALERLEDYPTGLKLFARYVLVPLVIVYLLILTAYAVKVVVTWDWPSGWIGWLVSVVAVVGILAYLLVHPVRRAAENRWVRSYGRWFWVALLPSVVLLGLAVWQRVDQYGLTEDRYFLAVGTVWLGLTALYYAVSRSEDIERIPQTLCVVALATFVGPWSAYRVSEASQLGRLRELLAANEMLVDGRAGPAPREVALEDRKEISAVVRYLVERHGEGSLAPLFGDHLPAADSVDVTLVPRGEDGAGPGDTIRRREARPAPERIVASLGIEYVDRWRGPHGPLHVSFHGGGAVEARSIAGYEHLVRGVHDGMRDTAGVALGPATDTAAVGATAGDGAADFRIAADSAGLRILRSGRPVLELSVRELARRLREEGHGRGRAVPPERMWIEERAGGLRAALWLESISASMESGGADLVVTSWRGTLLFGPADDGSATEGDVPP